jgi:protein arginine kinase activator
LQHKCDKCDRPAVHYEMDVNGQGQKIEKHLCTEHALEDPQIMDHAPQAPPIAELLSTFMKMHSSGVAEQRVACDTCGLTYAAFRQHSLLGCPQCYESFEAILGPLLERAHAGGERHMGKVPHRCGADDQRQVHLTRLRQRLDEAVAAEDYEVAADLRDQINRAERLTAT